MLGDLTGQSIRGRSPEGKAVRLYRGARAAVAATLRLWLPIRRVTIRLLKTD